MRKPLSLSPSRAHPTLRIANGAGGSVVDWRVLADMERCFRQHYLGILSCMDELAGLAEDDRLLAMDRFRLATFARKKRVESRRPALRLKSS